MFAFCDVFNLKEQEMISFEIWYIGIFANSECRNRKLIYAILQSISSTITNNNGIVGYVFGVN